MTSLIVSYVFILVQRLLLVMEKNIRFKMSDGKEVALKQIGNYKFLGRTLGKGNFARVELAEHKLTGAKVGLFVSIINWS